MGKTVKFQVKLQRSSEVSGSRRSAAAAAPPPAFTGSEHGACGPNACMYRLAPVRKAWAERRAFAPVFLAFVLRAKVSAAPADPRLIYPREPAITAKKKKIIVF